MKVTRPILRYFGGKWRLAPWLISLMPPHRTYVEPFGGAASVLLRKPKSEVEVYGDIDFKVVGYVKLVKECGKALAEAIEATPYGREAWEAATNDDVEFDAVRWARDTAVLSFMSHGSDGLLGCRAGFSDHRLKTAAWKTLPGAIRAASGRLRDTVIEFVDARETVRKYDSPDALIFADPPYPKSSRSSNHGYAHEFTDADHEALAEQLQKIRGKAMVSGYDCPLYRRLYAGWRTATHAALKDVARRAVETVWMNF